MEQGCQTILDVSRTKKGEKVVENIKTKKRFFSEK
jgi:hypothetical protein